MFNKSKNRTYNGFKKLAHNYKYKKYIRDIYYNIVIDVC